MTSGSNHTLVKSGVTRTSFTDTTVTYGTAYFCVVSVQEGYGESPNSSEVSAMPGPSTMIGEGRRRIPTLIIIGAQDRPIIGEMIALVHKPSDIPVGAIPEAYQKLLGQYQELAEKADEATKNSTLAQIRNTGHIPHLESTDKFYQTIISFLTP